MSIDGESSTTRTVDPMTAVTDESEAPAAAAESREVTDVVSEASAGEHQLQPEEVSSSAEELAAMARALERFHGRAEQYESIIRRMQNRIEELQSDQIRELLKPVIIKLASLHTEATEASNRATEREEDLAQKDFDYYIREIEEALSLLNIESIDASPLDEFVAAKHAARRRIATEDPSLDRKVAKVLRQGFTFVGAERVFLPAMVNVYRYAPPELVESGLPVDESVANPLPTQAREEGNNY